MSAPTSAEESLSPSPADASTTPPVDVEVAPKTLAAYRTLSDGMNGFFVKAQRLEEQHPGAEPKDAEAVKALVNYKFPQGVDLVEFSNAETGMCFVGPEDTHMMFADVDDHLRQTLGPGGCQDDDADIVVDINIDLANDDPDDWTVVWSANIVQGANVAAQIPGLHDFLDVLNTVSGVNEQFADN